MSCAVTIKDFPALGCLIEEGNLNTQARKTKYLGGAISPFSKGEIKVNLMLFSDEEMRIFAEWWVNSLNFGTNAFTITLPYFGATRLYTVFMTNNLVDSKKSGDSREILLELKQVI